MFLVKSSDELIQILFTSMYVYAAGFILQVLPGIMAVGLLFGRGGMV